MPFSSISEYKIVGTNIIGGRGVFKNAGGNGSIVLGNNSEQWGADDCICIGFDIGATIEAPAWQAASHSIIIGNRSTNFPDFVFNRYIDKNVIIGHDIGNQSFNNVIVGIGASNNGAAEYSTIIGTGAASNINGLVTSAVVLGTGAGANALTLQGAIVIGGSACYGANASGCVVIGEDAAHSALTCNNSVVIGDSSANYSQGINGSVLMGQNVNYHGLSSESILIGHNTAKTGTCYTTVFIGGQTNTTTNTFHDCVLVGNNISLYPNKTYTNSIVVAPNLTDANGTVIPDNSVIIGNSSASYLNFGQGKLVYQSANGLSVQGGLSVSGGASNFTRVNLSSALYAFDLVITTYFYIVATLPAPSAALKGARAFVSDLSNTLIFGATPIGGGTQTAPVWCDGTFWYIG